MIQVVHPGSRPQGSKRHRIPDPDPQHCNTDLLVMGGILSGDYAARRGEDCAVSGHEAPVLRDDAPLGGADHSVLRGQQASLMT
jgi:hypothetical protein